MHLFASSILCLTLCCFHIHITKARPESNSDFNKKYQAILFNLTRNESGSACPATTKQEKKINDDISITGRSIFLQTVYKHDEAKGNISLDICETSPQPVMVYNSKQDAFEIGYELYYEEGKIQLLEDNKYHSYKSVEINNKSKSPSKFVFSRHDSKNSKFVFIDGSITLVFHWISQVLIKTSKHYKLIEWEKNINVVKNNVQSKCQDHHLEGWNEINVSEARTNNESYKESTNHEKQSQKILKKSQIIPLWYFNTDSGRLASCTHMNVILVWKGIADGQLKKVDLFIAAVISTLESYNRFDQKVTFGVNGGYEQLNYTMNGEHHQLLIPKTIFRLVQGVFYGSLYAALIVIHNKADYIADSERLCSHETIISGWDTIQNYDPRTGITYVCQVTEELQKKLGVPEYVQFLPFPKHPLKFRGIPVEPLQLDAIPYSEHPSWDYTYPIEDHDVTGYVDDKFKKLLQTSRPENHH
ncbi:uncharacterized protein LOC135847225 isoform X1 [Planococcus citri]|uniref:uncharacterized protein LOC135847225 isoform X1 n=1 Tax=Planococcus citri TaxID=170843 RepID=UPI0031F9C679